jgi:O-antigen/teichoic acid export membrane protein
MSRFRRVVHGVASSYILLAATAVYSLASVPVALHYLNLPRFGLWIVMGTLAGYLNFIDAGMTSAAARLLIDHKDDRKGGKYGGFIQTGWLVSILQGAIIFVIGLSLAGTFARLLAIDKALQPEFIRLVNWQCGVVGLMFASRMLGLVLNAHQRMDLANYIGVVGLLLNFAAQWIFFHFNFGVLSLALGSLVSTVCTVMLQALAGMALKLFPEAGQWGRVSWFHFCEIFNFGKDVFLVGVGTQLIMTSQVFVISRMLGSDAVAIWGVGLRVFNLLNQVIWRVSDMSMAAFAEMLARGELARLRERYQTICMLSFSLSVTVAVPFALCNSLFVSLWTHGKIHWPMTNDCLLAIWMIILVMVHCHSGFILMTKQIGSTRYIYFAEGIAFVTASLLLARWGGLTAIIGCSIICSILFSGTYCTLRVGKFFGLMKRKLVIDWMRPALKIASIFAPMIILAGFLGKFLPNEWIRLAIFTATSGSLGAILFLRFGMPESFAEEVLRRAPKILIPALNHIMKPCNR